VLTYTIESSAQQARQQLSSSSRLLILKTLFCICVFLHGYLPTEKLIGCFKGTQVSGRLLYKWESTENLLCSVRDFLIGIPLMSFITLPTKWTVRQMIILEIILKLWVSFTLTEDSSVFSKQCYLVYEHFYFKECQ